MAYDDARREVVLFGGFFFNGSVVEFGDTWLWDGATWRAASSPLSPRARSHHAMAYDPLRNRVVLFGGIGPVPRSDTWEWDGTTWTPLAPATSPPERYNHAMTFDEERARIVLSGGRNFASVLADTWEWDGAAWQRTADGLARAGHAAAWDPVRREVRVFGGRPSGGGLLQAPAAYRSAAPASALPFGAGCAGTAGTPRLLAAPFSRPWLGDVLALRLGPLAAAAPRALWVGRSNQSWGAARLPLSLAGLGMPGCWLLASPDTALPGAASGAEIEFHLTIPAVTALLGQSVFGQAVAADPAANPLGFVLSNGVRVTVGQR
jgi:hypothetical protein